MDFLLSIILFYTEQKSFFYRAKIHFLSSNQFAPKIFYLILGSVLGPDNWEEGSVDVGVEEYIGSAVGASEAELCDEGDVRQDLGISRGVRGGLHLRVLALRGS